MGQTKKIIWIRGIRAIAEAIGKTFGIDCTYQTVQYWKKLDPQFPASNGEGRYDRDECFNWVKKYLETSPKGQNGELDLQVEMSAKKEREVIKRDREKFEYERDCLGKYVERDKALQEGIAAIRTYHGFVCAEYEVNGPQKRRDKLTLLGASPETIAAFHEFDLQLSREQIDRIEAKCEAVAK